MRPKQSVVLFSLSFLLIVPLLAAVLPAPPVVPNPTLTPGAVLPVTAKDVCVPGYAKKVRNVPIAVKRQVFARYGIPYANHAAFEVDHLISLELGGSNDVKNLWPEPWFANVGGCEEGAHVKDKLEDRLHALVCSGSLSLADAQQAISHDWPTAYQLYVGAFPRTTRP